MTRITTRLCLAGALAFSLGALAPSVAESATIPLTFVGGGQTFTADLSLDADMTLNGSGSATLKGSGLVNNAVITVNPFGSTQSLSLVPDPTNVSTNPTGTTNLNFAAVPTPSLQNAGISDSNITLVDGSGVSLATNTAHYTGDGSVTVYCLGSFPSRWAWPSTWASTPRAPSAMWCSCKTPGSRIWGLALRSVATFLLTCNTGRRPFPALFPETLTLQSMAMSS